jgi:hypothetical protein
MLRRPTPSCRREELRGKLRGFYAAKVERGNAGEFDA